jgi:hypothetical protein
MVRLASIRLIACPMSGSWPCSAVVNSVKKLEPMPTMTASTITLMPDETTLPSTRSARKLVRFQSANGTRMKPASEVSLNSMIVTNICTARMKKVMITIAQANSRTAMVRKLSKKVVNPVIGYLLQQWPGGGEPRACKPPGLEQIGRGHAAATGSEAGLRERAEDDVGKRREAVQDERERADIEDLLEEAADHIVVAAHRPEKSGQRDVNADQRHGQEVYVTAEQPEARVDVADEACMKRSMTLRSFTAVGSSAK